MLITPLNQFVERIFQHDRFVEPTDATVQVVPISTVLGALGHDDGGTRMTIVANELNQGYRSKLNQGVIHVWVAINDKHGRWRNDLYQVLCHRGFHQTIARKTKIVNQRLQRSRHLMRHDLTGARRHGSLQNGGTVPHDAGLVDRMEMGSVRHKGVERGGRTEGKIIFHSVVGAQMNSIGFGRAMGRRATKRGQRGNGGGVGRVGRAGPAPRVVGVIVGVGVHARDPGGWKMPHAQSTAAQRILDLNGGRIGLKLNKHARGLLLQTPDAGSRGVFSLGRQTIVIIERAQGRVGEMGLAVQEVFAVVVLDDMPLCRVGQGGEQQEQEEEHLRAYRGVLVPVDGTGG